MKSWLIVGMIVLLMVVPAIAIPLQEGDPCLLTSQCDVGLICPSGPGESHVCTKDYCTDGVCILNQDCQFCPELNGKKGECTVTDCGFITAKCSDNVCEQVYDCVCANYGDCGYLLCNPVPLVIIVFAVAAVIIFLLSFFKKKIWRK